MQATLVIVIVSVHTVMSVSKLDTSKTKLETLAQVTSYTMSCRNADYTSLINYYDILPVLVEFSDLVRRVLKLDCVADISIATATAYKCLKKVGIVISCFDESIAIRL